MTIDNVRLRELLPEYMREDGTVKALSAAIDTVLSELGAASGRVNLLNVDQLPEPVLDALARDYNVTWYDYSADLETKRRAIKAMRETARIMGTKQAVINVVEAMLGGEADVAEWWQYSAAPFHFRVTSSGHVLPREARQRLYAGINKVKNVRSVMDEMTWEWNGPTTAYMGGAAQIYIHANGVMTE